MPMRLQEVHPSLVHFPITLLPASLAVDAVGRLTDSEDLMELGRRTMPIAAASGLLAGLFGIVSQQTVNLDESTTDLLITHRNLNLGVVGLSFLLAAKRSRRRRPSLGYLVAGAAAVGAVVYSSYLGGNMVYEHGVGVEPAGGLNEEAAPELTAETAGEASRMAVHHLEEGFKLTAEEVGQGKLVPAL